VSALGILFGLIILNQLKNLPVHRSMREISELIYETCKTYLVTQGRFLAILEMAKLRMIRIYQSDPLAPLLELPGGSAELFAIATTPVV